ncbi:hypothetical protein VKT23_012002 [Stygiomarasmius scandens]|uniref:Cytochrome P450 n=1 Tax=Marasmiellus scandens TaxID=2682957 RepID=A0ABR1JA43_9AGAR
MFDLQLDSRAIYTILAATPILWALRTYADYRALTQRDGVRLRPRQIIGPVTFLPAESDLAKAFNSSSRFALGYFLFWLKKRDWYEKTGWDVCYAISLFPRVKMTLLVGDPHAFKHIASSRATFPKPVEQYTLLTIFGHNIVASEGDLWKKYRKICAPAFSERNNRLVWDSSIRIMSDFMEIVWGQDEKQIVVEDLKVHCTEWTLRVIAAAAFGQEFSWKKPHEQQGSTDKQSTSDSINMEDMEEIFETVSKDLVLKLILPEWFMNHSDYLTWGAFKRKLARVKKAYSGLTDYLHGLIETRRKEGYDDSVESRADLFSNLLKANEADEDEEFSSGISKPSKPAPPLNDAELIGNIFVFLLAGHETSAHSICFALYLLALYPEEQNKLYKSIEEVCPDGCFPKYEDVHRLTRTIAVLYETLRLFPPATMVPKKSGEDTSITTTNESGDTLIVPVPEGTQIVLHPPGVHYHPGYWQDPSTFNPDRFMPDSPWPRDAFVPFSAGSRSCIGRRFSEIESVALISSLISRYEISVKEEEEYRKETFEERKRRILRATSGPTITPVAVPLVFTRRF